MIPDWAGVAKCLTLGALITLLVWVIRTDADEITRRLRQGTSLLGEAGPWLVSRALHPWSLRGRRLPRMDPHHPSVKAASARGERPLSDEEAQAFAGLEYAWNLPAVADSERLSPRGEG